MAPGMKNIVVMYGQISGPLKRSIDSQLNHGFEEDKYIILAVFVKGFGFIFEKSNFLQQ
jgi:hypothetical protein